MKVYSEFKPNNVLELLISVLAVIGLFRARGRPETIVLAGLLLVNAAAIAMTWSVQGRFVVPQLFALYALAGSGISGPSSRQTDTAEQP